MIAIPQPIGILSCATARGSPVIGIVYPPVISIHWKQYQNNTALIVAIKESWIICSVLTYLNGSLSAKTVIEICSFLPNAIAAPIAVDYINKIITISFAPVMDVLKKYLKTTSITVIPNTANKHNEIKSSSVCISLVWKFFMV